MARHEPKRKKVQKRKTSKLSFRSHGSNQAAFSSTRKTDVSTELLDLFLDRVQRMLHGYPEEHITPLDDEEEAERRGEPEVQLWRPR